ncbi:MAG: hypothetical protein UY48_C0022G0014 [Candidatus Gottesmanbacteria bacterium GW2011_GWB1_49_7]|uniref:Uncharacterized protein n=1 Tax=Candidatus Gottesmanbacteria bacterium GW2011_GWB1_49_7 TaxID=1618448 RepID=A0A0G1VXT2_9BACT|nr:MAG: hypothetical protein UY48_C0022G0014 [Candidatus Gottesmanbacteria bacterium GW2011_GWB1_49_7]
MSDRDFWILIRSALLLILDAIERRWEIEPRTAILRSEMKYATIKPTTE